MNVLLVMASAFVVMHVQTDDIVTEKIPLQNSPPSYVLGFLLQSIKSAEVGLDLKYLPPGIRSVVGYDREMTIIATGTQEGINEVKRRVALLDIKPREVRVDLKLLYTNVDNTGRADVRVRREASFTSMNNTTTTLNIQDFAQNLAVTVTPRINGDDSVSLKVEFRTRLSNEPGAPVVTSNRRIKEGQKILLRGISQDPQGRAEIPNQFQIDDPSLHLGYYVELSVISLPRGPFKPVK